MASDDAKDEATSAELTSPGKASAPRAKVVAAVVDTMGRREMGLLVLQTESVHLTDIWRWPLPLPSPPCSSPQSRLPAMVARKGPGVANSQCKEIGWVVLNPPQ